METVWYCAPYDEIFITHRDQGSHWSTPETYKWDYGDGPMTIPNRLGLIRDKINDKNWSEGVKAGYLIKLGVL